MGDGDKLEKEDVLMTAERDTTAQKEVSDSTQPEILVVEEKEGEPGTEEVDGIVDNYKDLRAGTFNMNSIVSMHRKKKLWQFLSRTQLDVVFITELRTDRHRARKKIKGFEKKLKALEYNHIVWNDSQKKGHYGTAVFSKLPISYRKMKVNDTVADNEGRIIIAQIGRVKYLLTYVPVAGFDTAKCEKRKAFDKLIDRVITEEKEGGMPLVWVGDLNICPEWKDIDTNMRGAPELRTHSIQEWPGCTEWERSNFNEILEKHEMVDVYNYYHPKGGSSGYTWAPTHRQHLRGIGARLDYVIAPQHMLKPSRVGPWIDSLYVDRAQMGSDHVPLLWIVRNGKVAPHNTEELEQTTLESRESVHGRVCTA